MELYEESFSCVKTNTISHFAVKFVEKSSRHFSVYSMKHFIEGSALLIELQNFTTKINLIVLTRRKYQKQPRFYFYKLFYWIKFSLWVSLIYFFEMILFI